MHHALESSLKMNLKMTAAVLGEMADLESGECWPTYETIARRSSVERRQAIRNVNKLIELGVVTKIGTRPCQNGDVNVYRVSLEILQGMSIKVGVSSTTPVSPTPSHGVSSTTPRTIIKPSAPKEKVNQKERRSRICPEDWLPKQEQMMKLRVQYPTMNLVEALEEMKGHAFDKPKDHWNLVFNTWCRNKHKWSKTNEKANGGRKVHASESSRIAYREKWGVEFPEA